MVTTSPSVHWQRAGDMIDEGSSSREAQVGSLRFLAECFCGKGKDLRN